MKVVKITTVRVYNQDHNTTRKMVMLSNKLTASEKHAILLNAFLNEDVYAENYSPKELSEAAKSILNGETWSDGVDDFYITQDDLYEK